MPQCVTFGQHRPQCDSATTCLLRQSAKLRPMSCPSPGGSASWRQYIRTKKMKTVFLASVAATTLIAAPAFAQDAIGSAGIAYTYADVDGTDVNRGVIDGTVASSVFGDWTVTFNAEAAYTDVKDAGDETTLAGAVHLSKKIEDMRFGGFYGASELGATTLNTFGLEGQKYLDRATLTGVVSYGTAADADIWTVAGDAAFYAT